MEFKESDNLQELKAGDILVLGDGAKHEAIYYGDEYVPCHRCSMDKTLCNHLYCDLKNYIFKKVEHE